MKQSFRVLAAFIFLSIATAVRAGADVPTVPTAAPATQPAITLITLHLKQAMPEDVFNDIGLQAGVHFFPADHLWDQPALQIPMDVDVTNQPFWAVVLRVCRMWNLRPAFSYGTPARSIDLVAVRPLPPFAGQPAQPRSALPACESEGFVVLAQSFERKLTINYDMPDRVRDSCSLVMLVYIDPALHLESADQFASQSVENNGTLNPQSNPSAAIPGGSMFFFCTAAVPYPKDTGKLITDLKCVISLRAADQVQKISIDNPLAAHSIVNLANRWKITFCFLNNDKNAIVYHSLVTVEGDDDPLRRLEMMNSTQLTDAKGRAFRTTMSSSGGLKGYSAFSFDYSANPADAAAYGPPTNWLLEVPLNSRSFNVPIELKNLVVP